MIGLLHEKIEVVDQFSNGLYIMYPLEHQQRHTVKQIPSKMCDSKT